MTINFNLTEQIKKQCEYMGISYGTGSPREVTPGCYLFNAIPRNGDHPIKYYAVVLDERVLIREII